MTDKEIVEYYTQTLQRIWSSLILKPEDLKVTMKGTEVNVEARLFSRAIDFIPVTINLNEIHAKSTKCQHDWSEYIGFNESYKFCRKCDEKTVV